MEKEKAQYQLRQTLRRALSGSLLIVTTIPVLSAAEPKADPAARQLMEEARAHRATWGETFPGFTADLRINYNGQVQTGTITVSPTGQVSLTMPEGPAKTWAAQTLTSMVQHRLREEEDEAEPQSAFRFGSDDHHPLGRLVLSGDDMHSSFRIQNQQIRQVNRTMKDVGFTIAVLENEEKASGKYLPRYFTVSYFNPRQETLLRTETFQDAFIHVGEFDLPLSRWIVRAENRGVQVLKLELSQHRLSATNE